jgi:hypothetical protein
MPTTTTCAVKASDFSHRTTDPLRDEWTAGKLRHLIAALDGTPVIVTVDRQTGHTLVGVELVGLRASFASSNVEVGVRSQYTDGTSVTCWHLAFSLGSTIIPLGDSQAKWNALRSYGDEQSAAIQRAQAEHGEPEGRAWGEWDATLGHHHVGVTYTPHTTNPAFADRWGERGYWIYNVASLTLVG